MFSPGKLQEAQQFSKLSCWVLLSQMSFMAERACNFTFASTKSFWPAFTKHPLCSRVYAQSPVSANVLASLSSLLQGPGVYLMESKEQSWLSDTAPPLAETRGSGGCANWREVHGGFPRERDIRAGP